MTGFGQEPHLFNMPTVHWLSWQPMVWIAQHQQNNAPESYKELQAAAWDSRNNDLIIIVGRKEFAPLLDKL
jgi:hypothetical protein